MPGDRYAIGARRPGVIWACRGDLGPLPGDAVTGALLGVFVAHELRVGVSFPVARGRLAALARGGWLGTASEDAYQEGFTTVIQVGPFGDRPGAAKRVRVRFLDPVHRGEAMTVGLRWEATGLTGALFPVLDADISLSPAGEEATRLALAGAYRPPLDGVGATLDKVILHRVATATIATLLEHVASALASPGTAPGRSKPTAPGMLLRRAVQPDG